MILKLLLIVGVISVVYIMFFKKKPSAVSKKQKTQTKQNKDINELVKCENCDVYVELNEAILSHAKYYCCTECAQKGSL